MTLLRVMVAHAQYRQRGGEDVVAEQESDLLERRGHPVHRFIRRNRDIDETRRVHTAWQTVWSKDTVTDLTRAIDKFRPDILHVHNTFPALSPSLYWAAARAGTPIVQTLHNFRLLCPQAMLLRDGSVCENCVGRLPLQAVVHRCYRGSRAQSVVVAGMLTVHRSLGTYRRKIARYIALNEFCRLKFIAGGLPADKVAIKPNFADVPRPDLTMPRQGALFVGRVSQEKGVDLLLGALALHPELRIEIVGHGPEYDRIAGHPRIVARGWLQPEQLLASMRVRSYLVLPSIWYENSPRTLIEAFGCGLPVIASRLGALAELVDHGRTGLLFDPSSATDLAATVHWADAHPAEMHAMGVQARREFERLYTPESSYQQLITIYQQAIESHCREKAA